MGASNCDRRRTASAEDFNPNHFTLKNRSRAQDIGLLSSGGRYEAGGPVRWAVRGHTGSPEILVISEMTREGKGLMKVYQTTDISTQLDCMTIVGPHLAAQPPIERPTQPQPSGSADAGCSRLAVSRRTVSRWMQVNLALGIVLAGPSRVRVCEVL